jgi:hypothetical protein
MRCAKRGVAPHPPQARRMGSGREPGRPARGAARTLPSLYDAAPHCATRDSDRPPGDEAGARSAAPAGAVSHGAVSDSTALQDPRGTVQAGPGLRITSSRRCPPAVPRHAIYSRRFSGSPPDGGGSDSPGTRVEERARAAATESSFPDRAEPGSVKARYPPGKVPERGTHIRPHISRVSRFAEPTTPPHFGQCTRGSPFRQRGQSTIRHPRHTKPAHFGVMNDSSSRNGMPLPHFAHFKDCSFIPSPPSPRDGKQGDRAAGPFLAHGGVDHDAPPRGGIRGSRTTPDAITGLLSSKSAFPRGRAR